MAESQQPLICVHETGFRTLQQEATDTTFDPKAFVTLRRILGYTRFEAEDVPEVVAFGGISQSDGTIHIDKPDTYRVIHGNNGLPFPVNRDTPQLQPYRQADARHLVCPLPRHWSGQEITRAILLGHQGGELQLDADNHLAYAATTVAASTVATGVATGLIGAPNVEAISVGSATGFLVSSLCVAIPVIGQIRRYYADKALFEDQIRRAQHLRPLDTHLRPSPWVFPVPRKHTETIAS